MDTIKIGKFIASSRKTCKLTQMQLADELCISDKTVSKWECGNGLPDVSIMLPLCERLNINVNDLLSAENVTNSNYQKKAEENMMNLIKENEENKKKMRYSKILIFVGVIAVIALVMLASLSNNLPSILRVLCLGLAIFTAIVSFQAAGNMEREAGMYECPTCHALFVPDAKAYTNIGRTLTKRNLTCPECNKTAMCKHIITK
ncbi:MAG: helix-turn-helix transcriptional regulator [Erysipelotrichaceae bacterium]